MNDRDADTLCGVLCTLLYLFCYVCTLSVLILFTYSRLVLLAIRLAPSQTLCIDILAQYSESPGCGVDTT